MPQAMGAMCSKTVVNRILRSFGYRAVLVSNTVILALLLFSTMQQLSISFGVAAAGLATALFVPNRSSASPPQMILGVHRALVSLAILTIFSTLVFAT